MIPPEALPNPYLPAYIGLAGVAVGAFITQGAELFRRHQTSSQDKVYLAVIVSAELDKFISGCWDVSCDDGTYMGQPAGRDGSYEAQSVNPKFEPSEIDVNWKALNPSLLAEIWEIPRLIYDANGQVYQAGLESSSFDNSALAVRSYEYEKLGLEAARLSSKLRRSVKLPESRPTVLQTLKQMKERVEAYDNRVARWQQENGNFINQLSK